MRFVSCLLLCAASAMSCLAQLSADQKLIDFQVLAGLFAKNYGAYEWKRDAVKFDLYNVAPWITRINNSKSDLEFYEICAEYVTGLKDVHVEFFVPSDFEAKLGFNVDIYDGKYLIDAIDRTVLDAKAFPFQIGDEVVSIDGKSAQDWVDYISQFQSFGEVRPTSRYSAVFLTNRIQSVIPRAAEIGDKASVVVRLQSGELFTYQIPWTKTGTALTSEGPVPTPKVRAGFRTARRPRSNPLPPAAPTTVEEALRGVPAYKASLARLQFNYASKPIALRGVGDPRPVFKMPATFRQHSNPLIYDGVFTSGGLRVGYLRIPDFEPTDAADLDIAYTYFDREIKYLQANTDGLVVDVMRNFGGFSCYSEDLMTRLVPYNFQAEGISIRPTQIWLTQATQEIAAAAAPDSGAQQWEMDLLNAYYLEELSAFKENRGMTGPLPLCTLSFDRTPVADQNGVSYAYTKPMILLTDEFTVSAADQFAALFQDAKRGPVVGYRTAGAGGARIVDQFQSGVYSESSVIVPQAMMMRSQTVVTTDYPATRYVENVGVRPDILVDYMTVRNLLNNGSDFVDAFTTAIVAEINKKP
jgi:hypothetical protein